MSLAQLLARPWIDPLCLDWGLGLMLPAARAWAAASVADGDAGRFASLLGLATTPAFVGGRLRRTSYLRTRHEAAMAKWTEILFGGARGNVRLAEYERRTAAQSYLGQRLAYLPFALWHGLPAARIAMPEPAAALAEIEPARRDPDAWFRLPEALPAIERSRVLDDGDVLEYWLRFGSPVTEGAGDPCWVHVYEGKRQRGRGLPSLVFGHGLAMETEMLKADVRVWREMAARGLRILLPDAPGHNRRCPAGFYGGETFVSRPPLSALAHFRQAAREWAVLSLWCREQGSGRVAWGGISLGALTAQVAAVRQQAWPESARPDALLLLTTTDRVSALTFDSAIAALIGIDKAAAAKGWHAEDLAPMAAITDALGPAPLDPGAIVMLLGERDTVTPFAGGQRLARRWGVPAENLFLRDQGHFSAAFGLAVDPGPFLRLQSLLAA